MAEERFVEKKRVRTNISTNAKGRAQFDITVEVVDDEVGQLKTLLEESLEIAKTVAKDSGFEIAE